MFFNYECRQQITVILAAPVMLLLVEITDIFISHYSCYNYLKILQLSLLHNYAVTSYNLMN